MAMGSKAAYSYSRCTGFAEAGTSVRILGTALAAVSILIALSVIWLWV